MKKAIAIFTALMMVSACAPKPGQNQYHAGEVGQEVETEIARVIAVKKVNIQNQSTGIGAGTGMVAGAAAGSAFGNGNGQAGAVLAGLVLGAIVGAVAEQELQNQVGYQYTLVTQHKKVKTIVQNQNPEDVVFHKGDRVMIQTQGSFHRVMSLDDVPDEVKKPKGINVVD